MKTRILATRGILLPSDNAGQTDGGNPEGVSLTVGTQVTDAEMTGPDTTVYTPSGQIVSSTTKYGSKISKTWTGSDLSGSPPPMRQISWREPSWFAYRRNKSAQKRLGGVHTKWVRADSQPITRPPHNYQMTYSASYHQGCTITTEFPDGSSSVRTTSSAGLRLYIPPADNYFGSNDIIALQGKLRTKIVGSSFDLGTFLAEGHQALGMITDASISIARALSYVRRGDMILAAEALFAKPKGFLKQRRFTTNEKTISSRWLELQYGWLPLLSDIHDAAEFCSKLVNFPMVQTYKVRMKRSLQYSFFSEGAWTDQYHGCIDRLQLIAKLREVDVPQLVGLTDPLTIGWEILPYSFVADWFLPIGSWLEARGMSDALNGEFITTKSTFERCSFSGPNGTAPDGTKTSTEWPSAYPMGTLVRVNRTVSSFLSTPLPTFRALKDVPSWRRCSNAVALTVQAFSGLARAPRLLYQK